MSADHRKPVVAFVVLAFLAAALVGVQRADAQAGRFMAAVLGGDVHAQGRVPTLETRPSGPSTLPDALALSAGAPTASAAPEVASPHARLAEVSRGHGRSDVDPVADVRPSRDGEHGPADRAAAQARSAAAKAMPEHAVANGHTAGQHDPRAVHSRSTR